MKVLIMSWFGLMIDAIFQYSSMWIAAQYEVYIVPSMLSVQARRYPYNLLDPEFPYLR